MSGSINHSEEMSLGLEFPQSNIDGDTSLTLSFELVQNPGVLERTLTGLGGLLLVLSDDSLVDTSTLVDQVSSGRGFTGVDVSDNDKGNVRFLVAWHCLKDFENYFFFDFLLAGTSDRFLWSLSVAVESRYVFCVFVFVFIGSRCVVRSSRHDVAVHTEKKKGR